MKKLILALLLLASTVFAFTPGVFDITMQAGEDFKLSVGLADSTGADINLTGNTYAAQFRSAPAPGGVVFATYSAYSPSPATGQITVKLSSAQTSKQSGKSGIWDLKQTDSAGQVSYLLTGKCAVKPTATR
jgi:hypothetical protein